MNLQGSASMKITATGSASSRMNLGIHHLYSACKAAARIEAVEKANKGQPFGEFWDDESPRVLRRLQPLRRWSHEQIKQVFP